ncbi:enoyl-CoA hydratase [Corallococcus coralloides]|uniref:CorF n=1 Tax=Corallococcus coralloides TaxID=184914 RepID=D7RK28_CORCK|nr:enoyl-CoA hydratase-related protein [Corallococcus coralloides]ADI59528.1 CorF [Corallococcus coralloides]QAT84736.1 enoyl-CoA hydratase [Corallococcus coralloides]
MRPPAILRESDALSVRLTFNRTDARNSINLELLTALNAALDEAERSASTKVVVLRAQGDTFSSGMDFTELLASGEPGASGMDASCALYFRTLRRLSGFPKLVVSLVEGKVMAGGVGIVAASDLVLASRAASFSLPEILWGILPAMVLPFLARRVGMHHAYTLALTAQQLGAERALELGLVDELGDDAERALQRLLLRFKRIPAEGIHKLKRYANDVFPIDERVESLAVQTTTGLSLDPAVRQRIHAFLTHQSLPWEQEGPR